MNFQFRSSNWLLLFLLLLLLYPRFRSLFVPRRIKPRPQRVAIRKPLQNPRIRNETVDHEFPRSWYTPSVWGWMDDRRSGASGPPTEHVRILVDAGARHRPPAASFSTWKRERRGDHASLDLLGNWPWTIYACGAGDACGTPRGEVFPSFLSYFPASLQRRDFFERARVQFRPEERELLIFGRFLEEDSSRGSREGEFLCISIEKFEIVPPLSFDIFPLPSGGVIFWFFRIKLF